MVALCFVPSRTLKYNAFEGGTVIPSMVCWPGHVPRGKVAGTLISQIDWVASLGQLLHAHIPKGNAPDSTSS